MIGPRAGSTSDSSGGAGFQHLAVGELRQEFLDPVVEADAALFQQQQQRAGGEQLGVGEGAEDMIGAQRDAALAIRPAQTLLIDDVAPAQHAPGHAGEDLLIHVALHGGADGGEIAGSGVHAGLPR